MERVLPAVVNVTTDVFQQGGSGQGVGTGFIVRSDGVIVTNCHVVENASKITVFTSEADPTQFDARVIGSDCLHDLAVLKIDANGHADRGARRLRRSGARSAGRGAGIRARP